MRFLDFDLLFVDLLETWIELQWLIVMRIMMGRRVKRVRRYGCGGGLG